jgi:predicted membrane metal-binding protein
MKKVLVLLLKSSIVFGVLFICCFGFTGLPPKDWRSLSIGAVLFAALLMDPEE